MKNNGSLRKARDHVLVSRVAIKTTMGTFMERGRAGRELDLLMRHATGVSKATNVARYAKILLETDVPNLLIGWHRDVDNIWRKELVQFKPAVYTGSESDRQEDEAVRRFLDGDTNAGGIKPPIHQRAAHASTSTFMWG
jgi:hypothetical protein